MNGQTVQNAAMEVALAAHEISDFDRHYRDLAQRDLEKHRLWHKTPVGQFLRPYWVASEKPCAPLLAKATMLRLNQSKLIEKRLLAHLAAIRARCAGDSAKMP